MRRGNEGEGQRFKEGLEYLKTLDYIPKAHMDFFEQITRAHAKAKDRVAKDKIYPSITKKSAQEMLSQGFPMVNFDRMRVKTRPLRTHLKEICSILSKYEKTKPKTIDTFLKSDHYKKVDPKQLITKIFSHDAPYFRSLSEKTGVEENTLKFIAATLARPFFEVAASEVRDRVKDDSWWKNYCPVCGSEPFMVRIRKGDGMRILQCSLCSMEWRFKRVQCPFCNNEDQKSLKFFFYHQESPHRLYVCDKCKRYIKSIDERKLSYHITDLSTEDMATLYLDTLAREKGYISPWFLGEGGEI